MVGGDIASHLLTSENYYHDKIPTFIDNEMGECLGTSIASATLPNIV